MSKNNINAKNVNTRNFNYHTLSRDGIRGGMEWVTMPERDWGFVSNQQVQSFGGGFNIKGSRYGTLYVEPHNIAHSDSSGNFLVFVDNSGIGHTIAGGGGIGYWTTVKPGGGSIGGGGYIRPMKDISSVIIYDDRIKSSNLILQNQHDPVWNDLQYTDTSNQPVHLDNAALIVMDKMQFLEASGNVSAGGSPAGLGTIRYTYEDPGTGVLDPSGSSFQGLVHGPNDSSHWVKFGEGQHTAITYWRNANLGGGAEKKVTTTGISPGGITLELQGADASAHYSVAIGLNSKTRLDASGSVAIGIRNTTSAPGAVALGYDCSACGICSFADGSGCIARGDYSVALGYGADTSNNYQFVLGISNEDTASGMANGGGNTFFIDNSQNVAIGVGGDPGFDVSRCRTDVPVLDVSGDVRVRGKCNINLQLIVTDISATHIYTQDLSATDISAIHINVTDISATNIDVTNKITAVDISATHMYTVDLSAIRIFTQDLSATDISAIHINVTDISATNIDVTNKITAVDISATHMYTVDLSAIRIFTQDLSATDISAIHINVTDISATNIDIGACSITSNDASGVVIDCSLSLNCHSLLDISGIYFCDGTYIGQGNSFDISTNQLLHIKSSNVTIGAANNTARGSYAVAMGVDCSAGGIASFADGSGCIARGDYSVALGYKADTSNNYQFALGISNEDPASGMATGGGNTFFIDNNQNVAMCVGGDPSFDISRCRSHLNVPVLDVSGDVRIRGICDPLGLGLINVTKQEAKDIFNSMDSSKNAQLLFSNKVDNGLWHCFTDTIQQDVSAVPIGGGTVYGSALWKPVSPTPQQGLALTPADTSDASGIKLKRTLIYGTDASGLMVGDGNDASGQCSVAIGQLNTAEGDYSVAMGQGNTTSASASVAMGWSNTTDPIARYSVAMGAGNHASGSSSVAMGEGNHASGSSSVAMGSGNHASGGGAVAMGWSNHASGGGAVAMGDGNTAEGEYSVAMGSGNEAAYGAVAMGEKNTAGTDAVAMGTLNWAFGSSSVAMGEGNDASGNHSVAMGQGNDASGGHSVAMGSGNTTSAAGSVAMGWSNTASGPASVAMGEGNTAKETHSVAMGTGNTAWASASVAMGSGNHASGGYSVAMGSGNHASGEWSMAMGADNTAKGVLSVAMGDSNDASGQCSVAMGQLNTAGGGYSVAMGTGNQASGSSSVAMGLGNEAAGGNSSVAMGANNTAGGNYSVAMGADCVASGNGSVAMGIYAHTYNNHGGGNPLYDADFIYTPSGVDGTWLAPFGGSHDNHGCPANNSHGFFQRGNGDFVIWGGDPPVTIEISPANHPGAAIERFATSSTKTFSNTFIIPHPEHEGKMLRHACIEAPTRGTNIYEYQLEATEPNQTTKITLPSYFKHINGRPRVYVTPKNVLSTCCGDVDEELIHAIILTEKPGIFNVMVTGVRKDPGAVKYAPSIYIDEPIAPEDIPPSQTVVGCGSNYNKE